MGTLISNRYDVAEGREWCDYLERVIGECHRLRGEGRLPESAGLDPYLDDIGMIVRQVRSDVVLGAARGEREVTTSVGLTAEEHKRLVMMSESLRTLLEILELRKAVVLDRTPAVGRVAAALVEGQFVAA